MRQTAQVRVGRAHTQRRTSAATYSFAFLLNLRVELAGHPNLALGVIELYSRVRTHISASEGACNVAESIALPRTSQQGNDLALGLLELLLELAFELRLCSEARVELLVLLLRGAKGRKGLVVLLRDLLLLERELQVLRAQLGRLALEQVNCHADRSR